LCLFKDNTIWPVYMSTTHVWLFAVWYFLVKVTCLDVLFVFQKKVILLNTKAPNDMMLSNLLAFILEQMKGHNIQSITWFFPRMDSKETVHARNHIITSLAVMQQFGYLIQLIIITLWNNFEWLLEQPY
jgi:hypothetical protein